MAVLLRWICDSHPQYWSKLPLAVANDDVFGEEKPTVVPTWENVAIKRPAKQSSIWGGLDANRAIDNYPNKLNPGQLVFLSDFCGLAFNITCFAAFFTNGQNMSSRLAVVILSPKYIRILANNDERCTYILWKSAFLNKFRLLPSYYHVFLHTNRCHHNITHSQWIVYTHEQTTH